MNKPGSSGKPPIFVIDQMRVKAGRITAWGFCLSTGKPIDRVECETAAGTDPILAQFPLPRDEVAAVYPQYPRARASGFFLLGWLSPQASDLTFFAVHEDGTRTAMASYPLNRSTISGIGHLATAKRLLRRVHTRLRRGQLKALVMDTLDWIKRDRAVPEPMGDSLVSRVKQLHTPVTLILDHAMGGGANKARETTITERLAQGRSVLLSTIDLSRLTYHWELRGGAKTSHFFTEDLAPLSILLQLPGVDEVVLNNTVGFDDPLALNRILIDAARQGAVQLHFPLHDYFAICPSFPLIDHRGWFCDLPDERECAICMARNRASFMQLVPRIPIGQWRESWGEFLGQCTEIVSFSEASSTLLRRAYPNLPGDAIRLRPHDCSDIAYPVVPVDFKAPLHIGVVGHITYLKGAQVVADLVTEIEKRGLRILVTIFGKLDHEMESPYLQILGSYQPDELPGMIRKSGVNLVFFSSIWPETYSFVVQELMIMHLPVAAFRLGAPAQRLANYDLACLIDHRNAADTLDRLIGFHAELSRQLGPTAAKPTS